MKQTFIGWNISNFKLLQDEFTLFNWFPENYKP